MISARRMPPNKALAVIGWSFLLIALGMLIGSFVAVEARLIFATANPTGLGWAAGIVAAMVFSLVLGLMAPAGRTVIWITGATLALSLLFAVVRLEAPMGLIALTATQGPGTITAYHDSTFFAIAFDSPLVWLAERRQRLLRILSLALPLIAAGYLLTPRLKALRLQNIALRLRESVPLLVTVGALFLALNVLVGYWTTHSRYIFIWDHFGYWGWVRDLAGTLRDHGLYAALLKVIQSLKDEYNLIAALPPALFGALLPEVDRRAYVTLIANLYYIPACLAVYWLARLMVNQTKGHVPGQRAASVFPLILCAAGLYPVFFKVLLWGQPDIGGVILVVAAISLLDVALRGIADDNRIVRPSPAATPALFSLGILLVLIFLLLVLFRRWYLFMAIALGVIGTAAFLAAVMRASGRRTELLRRGLVLLTGGLVFLLVCAPAFLTDRILIMLRYSYAAAYSAYARDWPGELNFLQEYLGIVPLALSTPLLVVSLLTPGGRQLKWLALASAPMALALFWTVQRGLGFHHLNLLFVGLTVATAYGAWVLDRRLPWPITEPFAVVGSLLILTIWVTGNDLSHPAGLPHADLLPPRRGDIPELVRLGHFVSSEMSGGKRRFCVLGSNYTIARDIVISLWQVDDAPSFRDLNRYAINLSQVDTRDGPPKSIETCDLALVAEPVQLHLTANMQRCVSIPANDLLNNEGIGKAFHRRPETFNLREGVTIRAFDRIRPTAPEEWEQFLRRFNEPR